MPSFLGIFLNTPKIVMKIGYAVLVLMSKIWIGSIINSLMGMNVFL